MKLIVKIDVIILFNKIPTKGESKQKSKQCIYLLMVVHYSSRYQLCNHKKNNQQQLSKRSDGQSQTDNVRSFYNNSTIDKNKLTQKIIS